MNTRRAAEKGGEFRGVSGELETAAERTDIRSHCFSSEAGTGNASHRKMCIYIFLCAACLQSFEALTAV